MDEEIKKEIDRIVAEIKEKQAFLFKSKREIYKDSTSFMDNEDKIQWEQDHNDWYIEEYKK